MRKVCLIALQRVKVRGFLMLLMQREAVGGTLKLDGKTAPGPSRTADTRFRKPLLFHTELLGRGVEDEGGLALETMKEERQTV